MKIKFAIEELFWSTFEAWNNGLIDGMDNRMRKLDTIEIFDIIISDVDYEAGYITFEIQGENCERI